jgi:diamine N-acetyltransferase
MDAPARESTMKGFVMYEVREGTGFIMRVMIDQAFQRQGYGRATIVEVIRSLRLVPEVRIIAVSHRSDNQPAAALYASLGFKPWTPSGSPGKKDESYLFLDPKEAK